MTKPTMTPVRPLTLDDAEVYARHLARNVQTSGVGDTPIFTIPFGNNPDFIASRTKQNHEAWSKSLDTPGWERAWGSFDGESKESKLIGEVSLFTLNRTGRAQLHRAVMGMGIEPEFRGRGLGEKLLREAMNWAVKELSLKWVDLGVFANNAPARRLYAKFGFIETGRVVDCFRMGHHSLDNIEMTIDLAQLR